jgi:hypothetical protein
VSVAVLCNASGGQAERYAHAVADIYLGDKVKAAPPVAAKITEQEAAAVAGMYRNAKTGTIQTFVADKAAVRLESGPALVHLSASRFTPATGGRTYEFDGRGGLRIAADNNTADSYERVAPAKPTAAELHLLAGTYATDEAEVVMEVSVENGELKIARRPDTKLTLRPLYKDAFTAPGLGVVIFRRDGKGRVTSFSVVQDRVWDLRLTRRAPGRKTS